MAFAKTLSGSRQSRNLEDGYLESIHNVPNLKTNKMTLHFYVSLKNNALSAYE